MIDSKNFVRQNMHKYRAKVEFKRLYDTNAHQWTVYYTYEKNCSLEAFIQSITHLIGRALANCIVQMVYDLYEFYYYAPNIKIRKYGDTITLFYDERTSRKA